MKIKIIFTMVFTLSLSMALYVWFALSLLKEDKSATISEMASISADRINENVKTFLGNYKKGVFLLDSMTRESQKESDQVRSLFESYSDFVQFSRYKVRRGKVIRDLEIIDQNFLEQYDLDKGLLDTAAKNWPLAELSKKKDFYQLSFLTDEIPLIEIFMLRDKTLLFARLRIDGINRYLDSYNLQDNIVLLGKRFIGLNAKFNSNKDSFKNLLDQVDFKRGTKEITLGDKSYLMGVSRENNMGFVTSSLVELDLAYKAIRYLQQKSAYFALMLLSLAVLLGVLISRRMTKGLQNLFDSSQKFASGELDVESRVGGSDEIGALSDSFNHMTGEIRRYMGEMEEKLRMERELEVARLVQDSFFPQDIVRKEDHQVCGFYHPASECGGDWWGYLDEEDWTLVIIADATGHGVPAALITATANCCLENLKTLYHEDPSREISPSYVLKFMNKAIKGVGSDILMTAFVAIYRKKENLITFANASHQPALLYPMKEGGLDKSEIKSLMSNPGARLGHEENPEYEEKSLPVETGSRLFFYTDGIVETENDDAKQYGQRRLLKHLGGNAGSDIREQVSALKQEVFEFHGSNEFEDDLTFVIWDFKTMEKGNKENVLYELFEKKLSHFIAPHADEKFKAINEKFNHLGQVCFEDVLGTGGEYDVYELESTKEINSIVDTAVSNLDYDGFFDSPRNYMEMISKELLSNAFYHKSAEQSSQDRTEPIQLDREKILLKIGKGANGLCVSVTDPFGTLEKDALLSSLKRAYEERAPEEKAGGAGLGLQMVYENSDIVLVNKIKNVKTEIFCLIYPQKRYKKFRQQMTSFHFYEGDS